MENKESPENIKIIELIKFFCEQRKISTKSVLVITIQ